MEFNVDLVNNDSYLYARSQIIFVKIILKQVRLCANGAHWIQQIKIEEDKHYCIRCKKM